MMRVGRHILRTIAAGFVTLLSIACVKENLNSPAGSGDVDESIKGQRVLFSSGNVLASTKAESPYMEMDGRFVCTMYFKSGADATEDTPFDVDGGTALMSWLSVNNYTGNSVYRRRHFEAIEKTGEESYTKYGFDPDAEIFYWKNRLSHVFVAYADFNKLKTNSFIDNTSSHADPYEIENRGSLFMYPYYDAVKRTPKPESSWVRVGYKILRVRANPAFRADQPMDRETNNPFIFQTSTEGPEYRHWFCHLYRTAAYLDPKRKSNVDNMPFTNGTTGKGFYNYYSKYPDPMDGNVEKNMIPESLDSDFRREGSPSAEYLAPDGSTRRDEEWFVENYDNADPSTWYAFCQIMQKDIVYDNMKANSFDLTRPVGATSISAQPDPILAVTTMKPSGATQEANRVKLFFKHQFSQIQVNIHADRDGTASDIAAGNIEKVELLGVSEKGYVFTHITGEVDPQTGEALPIYPSYDAVDLSKYTADQLAENRYGTSFNMFEMSTPQGTALKSFDAIAFGILRAIRITWREDPYTVGGVENPGIEHVVTLVIDKDDRKQDLKTLERGMKYIYDIDLQRGSLTLIRTKVEMWQLDNDLNYSTEGTVNTTVSSNN